MSNEKKISIAMATYNGEKFLEEQMDSIIGQTYSNWELIVSDDGSSDKTIDIIKFYMQKDKRIKYYPNSHKHGCARNFENALHYCGGDFIAFCDQDDVWTADHLEHLYSIIGDKSIAFADAEAVDVNLNTLNFFLGEKFFITEEHLNKDLFLHLVFLNFVQGTAIMFRKEFLNFLPFPEALFHDHWAAIVAMLQNGIAYSSKSILKYRQHGNNTCGVIEPSFGYKLKKLHSEVKRIIDNYNGIKKFIDSKKDFISPEKYNKAMEHLEIARKIIFGKNILLFNKYYNVLFWDSNRKKFFSRYLMYCVLFPLARLETYRKF